MSKDFYQLTQFIFVIFVLSGCHDSASTKNNSSTASSANLETSFTEGNIASNSKAGFVYTPEVIVTEEEPGLMFITPKLAVVDGLFLSVTFIIPKPEDNVKFNLGGLAGHVLLENHVATDDFDLSNSTQLKLVSGNRQFTLSAPRRDDVSDDFTGLMCNHFRARDLHNFLSTDAQITLVIDNKKLTLPQSTRDCLRDLISKTTTKL